MAKQGITMEIETSNIEISFVIPLHNNLQITRDMFGSLQETLPSGLLYEIIFINDFSSDGTANWLKELSDSRIKYIENKSNIGYGASCNEGAKVATAPVVGFLNNDLILKNDWLAPMLEILGKPHLRPGVVGNIQRRIDNNIIDHAGVKLNTAGEFEHITSEGASSTSHSECFVVTGACFLIVNSVFRSVGGFSSEYINGGEDYDLCFKLKSIALKNYVCTTSVIQHHVSRSRRVNVERDVKNSRLLFSKWRVEIKRELSNIWHKTLNENSKEFSNYFDGEIIKSRSNSHRALAMVLAENLLVRKQRAWNLRSSSDCEKPEDFADRIHSTFAEVSICLTKNDRAPQAKLMIAMKSNPLILAIHGQIDSRVVSLPVAVSIICNGIQRICQMTNSKSGKFEIIFNNLVNVSTDFNSFEVSFAASAGPLHAILPCGDAINIRKLVINNRVFVPKSSSSSDFIENIQS